MVQSVKRRTERPKAPESQLFSPFFLANKPKSIEMARLNLIFFLYFLSAALAAPRRNENFAPTKIERVANDALFVIEQTTIPLTSTIDPILIRTIAKTTTNFQMDFNDRVLEVRKVIDKINPGGEGTFKDYMAAIMVKTAQSAWDKLMQRLTNDCLPESLSSVLQMIVKFNVDDDFLSMSRDEKRAKIIYFLSENGMSPDAV